MTEALYTVISEFVEEIKLLPVKRQNSVSGTLKKSGVSRSGYSAWKRHTPSNTEIHRSEVKERILYI